jgi:hypothetical protein
MAKYGERFNLICYKGEVYMLKFQLFFITVTIAKSTEQEKIAQIEGELFTKKILAELQTKRDRYPSIY